jgi:glycine dehydrogenase subunit 1
LQTPKSFGADIFAGEGSSLGTKMNFGGPQLGLFAATNKLLRQTPGRLVGETVDNRGNRCYCLTLSAREQHIKREKATSNICTASSSLAISFAIHLSLLGKEGFTSMAKINHSNSVRLAKEISRINGVTVETPVFFNEFTVKLSKNAEKMIEDLAEDKIFAGISYTRLFAGFPSIDEKKMLMTTSELTSEAEINRVCSAIRSYLN